MHGLLPSQLARQRLHEHGNCSLPSSFTLVVPGHGDPNRGPLLRHGIGTIASQLNGSGIAFSCLVFLYSPSVVADADGSFSGCQVVRGPGLWTNFLLQVSPPRHDDGLVAVLLDDVDLYDLKVVSFLEIMRWEQLDAAAAAVPNWRWFVHRPKRDCVLHRTAYIDPLFVTYTAPAFRCMQSLIDTTLDRAGWGISYVFKHACNVSMGILDSHVVLHRGSEGRLRSYNTSDAEAGMHAYLQRFWGLQTAEEGRRAKVAFEGKEMRVGGLRSRLVPLTLSAAAAAVVHVHLSRGVLLCCVQIKAWHRRTQCVLRPSRWQNVSHARRWCSADEGNLPSEEELKSLTPEKLLQIYDNTHDPRERLLRPMLRPRLQRYNSSATSSPSRLRPRFLRGRRGPVPSRHGMQMRRGSRSQSSVTPDTSPTAPTANLPIRTARVSRGSSPADMALKRARAALIAVREKAQELIAEVAAAEASLR